MERPAFRIRWSSTCIIGSPTAPLRGNPETNSETHITPRLTEGSRHVEVGRSLIGKQNAQP